MDITLTVMQAISKREYVFCILCIIKEIYYIFLYIINWIVCTWEDIRMYVHSKYFFNED